MQFSLLEIIRQAYRRRMLEASSEAGADGCYEVQMVREAYRNIVKGFGRGSHLSACCRGKDVEQTVCRCGSRYSLENALGCIVECMSCSCFIEIV